MFAKKQIIVRETSECEGFNPGSFSGSKGFPGMLQDPGNGGLEGSRKRVQAQLCSTHGAAGSLCSRWEFVNPTLLGGNRAVSLVAAW